MMVSIPFMFLSLKPELVAGLHMLLDFRKKKRSYKLLLQPSRK